MVQMWQIHVKNKCGNGFRNTTEEECDDANYDDNDGCSSTCTIEAGYTWGGGSDTSRDYWDNWGDGLVEYRATSQYCDDGNFDDNDGWDQSCNTETNWQWAGGNSTQADVWSDIWGDGYVVYRNSSQYCDDGNNNSNDGWDTSCNIESGYEWTGGDAMNPDRCHVKWGDGVLTSNLEQWDDGNEVSNDGWSSTCTQEQGFSCTTNSDNVPATTCSVEWGDGLKFDTEECDDGNLLDNDGCDRTCMIEDGYSWGGGSMTTADTCLIVWGDGIVNASDTTSWDDGNNVSGDGCSSDCIIEEGYRCTSEPSICTELWGNGRRNPNLSDTCDDGNLINGDGWSDSCSIEPGFVWSGGTFTKRDTCNEICGDGKDYGQNEWEDGNLVDGDGWDSNCQFEYWYQWYGGDHNASDVWSRLEINSTVKAIETSKFRVWYRLVI